MTLRRRSAHGATATRLALLAACLLVACGVDERASLGRFAEVAPPPAGAAGPPGPTGTPDAGRAPEPPVTPDAGGVPSAPVQEPPPGACAAPRTYAGTFVCALRMDGSMPFQPPPGSPPAPPMTASLSFGLAPSADGSVADLVASGFMFVAWEVAFTGRLEGQLDCASGRFDATIVDGMTGPVFGLPSTFVGALQGRLVDPVSGALEGTWWHGPMPGAGCTGAWSALPLPP